MASTPRKTEKRRAQQVSQRRQLDNRWKCDRIHQIRDHPGVFDATSTPRYGKLTMIPLGPHQIVVLTMTFMIKRSLRNHSKTRGNCFDGTREENEEVSTYPAFSVGISDLSTVCPEYLPEDKDEVHQLGFGLCRRAVLAPSCARPFPRAWGGICFAGIRADIAGGGVSGMKEGRANDGGSLVVERARAQRLVYLLHHSSSLSPPAPSQGSATADRVVFSPSLSASLAPARVPPPSLVILCTNRYRQGRAHHTPYRYRPPPPWLGVLECCVGGGRFRSKRRHAHDPSFHLAFAAGIGVVCGDDGCVPPLSRPVRRALLPLVSPARMAWQGVRSPGRNKSIHRFEWRPLGVDILHRGVPSPSTDGHDSPLLLPGSGHSREMEPSPIHGHRDIKWAQDPATTNAPFGAMVDGSRVATLGSAFTGDGTLSNSTSLVVSKHARMIVSAKTGQVKKPFQNCR